MSKMCYTSFMSEHSDDHLVALETKLAYLEDFVGKMQGILLEHTEALDRLKAENRALKGKLTELDDLVQDIPNRRPPHY